MRCDAIVPGLRIAGNLLVQEIHDPGITQMVDVITSNQKGETLFSTAVGMANISYGVPFGVDTPTNIGSTSKQFTAMAIQLLAAEGKLSLDDDIRTYIPEVPDFGKPITIRHLVHHTSGIRDWPGTLAIGALCGSLGLIGLSRISRPRLRPDRRS